MKVVKIGETEKAEAAAGMFTGRATMQSVVGRDLSAHVRIMHVNFEEGVRNKLHSHSGEQILIVTEGKGIVATEAEQFTIRPGDVIVVPAEERHWHGAAPGATFSHLYVMLPNIKTTQIED